MLAEQMVGKCIVPRSHRRVRGEDALRRHGFEPRIEASASERELLAQQFEGEECRVAFVHVPHGGLEAQQAQCAHAADAQHHLLLEPVRFITAVQPEGDVAVGIGNCRRRWCRAG